MAQTCRVPSSTLKVMNGTGGHAYELPEHGAAALDEAVAEAAAGETVYLTRDGRPVAAVVPPAVADRRAAADEALARIVAVSGAPTLADYQRVFTQLGRPWPGDDEVRRSYPVSA